jgi:hypothetical protein
MTENAYRKPENAKKSGVSRLSKDEFSLSLNTAQPGYRSELPALGGCSRGRTELLSRRKKFSTTHNERMNNRLACNTVLALHGGNRRSGGRQVGNIEQEG